MSTQSTRLYIILFSYSSNEIFNETIINPYGQEYEKLEEKYLSTLTCRCTQISIPYRDLITIKVNYLFYEEHWYEYKRRDIRVHSSAYFLFFSNLYQISQITINCATEEFLNKIFINTKLISESKFNTQIKNIILQL
ncbi:unnamed protein product [Adineta steineri]|uniref:Uncharacterized protein n=1 Tax=Adineta steineri TaxID=433720 RepID=A0A814R2P2_9BILA|nr:unnamed protein product [Adineta steineri]CAF1468717.1 unnamed protein product [Adineta steineri]CAF1469252.1 unnamed protein product [Adineta steineri]